MDTDEILKQGTILCFTVTMEAIRRNHCPICHSEPWDSCREETGLAVVTHPERTRGLTTGHIQTAFLENLKIAGLISGPEGLTIWDRLAMEVPDPV